MGPARGKTMHTLNSSAPAAAQAAPQFTRDVTGNVTTITAVYARHYASLGLHPILLHGVLPDGSCTCGRHAVGDRQAGKHPVDVGWDAAPLDIDALCARLNA